MKALSVKGALAAAACWGLLLGGGAAVLAATPLQGQPQAKGQGPGPAPETAAQGLQKPAPAKSMSYGFDDPAGEIMGWRSFDKPGESAVAGVERSTDQKRDGAGSLRVDLNFDATRQSGEVAVDFILDPPGEQGGTTGDPINMANRAITAYIKFRKGFPAKEDAPPGLQMFLRDAQHRSLYGCWQNIEPDFVGGELWIRLSLRTNMKAKECEGEELTPGFDPTQIRRLGVKIAANSGDPLQYQGSCYLDSVSWK